MKTKPKSTTEASRCPVEDDKLLLGDKRPLITGSETHTVFIKVMTVDQGFDTLNSGNHF